MGVVGLYTHETVISTRLSDRDDDNDNHDFTQVQRKRTKRTTRSQNKKAAGTAFLSGSGSTSQSSQLVQPNNISNVSLDPVKRDLQQQKTVQDLQSVVQSQQHTIQQLSCQLQFLLSFLGITECSSVSYDDNITPGTAVLGVNSSTSTAVTHPVQQPQQRSIPTVVVRASTNSAHARAVMSMTGFPSSSYVHPSSALTLCVVSARRLGVAGFSDRIRPLLVGLSSAEEASSLLSIAKSLRQSTDDIVPYVEVSKLTAT